MGGFVVWQRGYEARRRGLDIKIEEGSLRVWGIADPKGLEAAIADWKAESSLKYKAKN